MIDLTTIQTFDALPDLKALNETNIELNEENSLLNDVIRIICVCAGIYICYKVYLNIKEDEHKLSNKGGKDFTFKIRRSA